MDELAKSGCGLGVDGGVDDDMQIRMIRGCQPVVFELQITDERMVTIAHVRRTARCCDSLTPRGRPRSQARGRGRIAGLRREEVAFLAGR